MYAYKQQPGEPTLGHTTTIRLLLSGTCPAGGEAILTSIVDVIGSIPWLTVIHGAHPSVTPILDRLPERRVVLYSSERWPAPTGPHGPGVRIPSDGGPDPVNDLLQMRRRLCRSDIDRVLCIGGRLPARGEPSGIADELDSAYMGPRGASLQVVICGWLGGVAATMAPIIQRFPGPRLPAPHLTEEEGRLIAAPEMTDEGFAALRRWLSTP